MSGYDDILTALDAVPAAPGFWKARCPVHQGRARNLSLWIGRKGNLMAGCWRCHGHATGQAKALWMESFCQSLGIAMKDLFPAESENRERVKLKLVATYVYTDENDRPLCRKLRYEPKSFRQERWEDGRWVHGLGRADDVRRVLYRLPRVMDNPLGKVFLVEGEGKVELLESWGLVATCCRRGSSLWLDDYSRCLAGRDVVLLPDNDEPGRRFMDQAAGSLMRHGADSLAFLDLGQLIPGFPPGGDIKDLAAGGGRKPDLMKLLNRVPVWHS
jgi:hypothetical protein